MYKGSTLYFDTPGFINTTSVVQAVEERLKLGDIKTVVVPTTTGKTAQTFTSRLGENIEIVTVSEDEVLTTCKRITYSDQSLFGRLVRSRLESRLEEEIERSHILEAFDMTFLPFCGENWTPARETLYAFGQGMKVAVEVSIAAVEIKKVKPYTKIMAIGGTGEGADTAIVVRTSTQKEAFGKDARKRLFIQEIVAKPKQEW